jgi:hypothetical protein
MFCKIGPSEQCYDSVNSFAHDKVTNIIVSDSKYSNSCRKYDKKISFQEICLYFWHKVVK